MAGVKHLRRLQIGAENPAGTAVAATAALRMTGGLKDNREIVFPEEFVGVLGGTDRNYTSHLLAEMSLEGEATFEQFPYVLDASVKTVSGAADGAGSGFIYNYPFPARAKNTIKTYTLEGGDDNQAEEMAYSFVKEWTLSGAAKEAWMLSATWAGRSVAPVSFTASTDISLPEVEEMLFGRTKLYIDDSSGTIGSTLKSNTLMAAEVKYTSGWIEKFSANGELYFSHIEQVGDEITLDITFEHDASAVAEKAAWRAHATRQIRLLIEGSALATAGTTYSKKTGVIDLIGKWETFDTIDEIDGNDVVKGTFRGRYNVTLDNKGGLTIVNELTALA